MGVTLPMIFTPYIAHISQAKKIKRPIGWFERVLYTIGTLLIVTLMVLSFMNAYSVVSLLVGILIGAYFTWSKLVPWLLKNYPQAL
jgi:uncharacterized protein YneF (UPF0154 family)